MKVGVLKHELLHLVFKHPLRSAKYSNEVLYFLASDLVVNQYITQEYLWDGAVTIESFPFLKLKSHQTVDYYYRILLKYINDIKSIMEQVQCSELEKHEDWNKNKKMSSAEMDVLNFSLDKTIKYAYEKNMDAGNLPAGLEEYIRTAIFSKKPHLNWKIALKQFSTTARRSYLKNTIKRTSRRYGTIPGIKIKNRSHFVIAIDTSASISKKKLERFFEEIYHIYKAEAEITIVECDYEVNRVWNYKGQTPELVTGRGGTSFDSVIKYVNEEVKADGVIYFTDGCAPSPELKPVCPIFWLICNSTDNDINLPGRVVLMNNTGEENGNR
jgi:predicted metal-dependent peptidase